MSKPKVLYVDDENINLMLFELNLEKEYEVITALDGPRGLEILAETNDIQAVFSDMKMPYMNGIEFIKAARESFCKLPYFILTSFDITDEIQEALYKKLICKYFRKPFDMKQIAKEIDTIVKKE